MKNELVFSTPPFSFDHASFPALCADVGGKDPDLHAILASHGLPPLWSRTPNFATLVHIILEQQVSLASAHAAFCRLKSCIGRITPRKVLALSDAQMKDCAFSRQKTGYARHLAEAVLSRRLKLNGLAGLPDQQVREELKKIKGIGDWTVDVFLIMCLHRSDCFPTGDVALMRSISEVKGLPLPAVKEKIIEITDQWRPYRTIAAYLLWWAYIRKRNLKLHF